MVINGRRAIKLPIRFHCEILSQSWLIEYTVLDEAQNKTLSALQTLENSILFVSPKKIEINSRVNNAPYDCRGERYGVINEPCPFNFVYCRRVSDTLCTPIAILNAAVATHRVPPTRSRSTTNRRTAAERCGLWCHAQPEVQTTDEHSLRVINPLKPIVWRIICITSIRLNRSDIKSTNASELTIRFKVPSRTFKI